MGTTRKQERHMLNRITALTAALMLAAGTAATAQDSAQPPKKEAPQQPGAAAPTLNVGDKAPKLSIENWVKGDEVKALGDGKVYVVEFWATWCPPCVKSIPMLTEIQKDFKKQGVTVIGVASSEDRDKKIT